MSNEVPAQLASISTKLEGIDRRLENVETTLDDVKTTVNRWKGALALLGVLGAAAYYLSSIVGKMGNIFKT